MVVQTARLKVDHSSGPSEAQMREVMAEIRNRVGTD